MSKSKNLDIRIPIGGLFVILGLLLSVYGLFTIGDTMYDEKSLGMNINLMSGVFMLIFGLIMFIPAWKQLKSENIKE